MKSRNRMLTGILSSIAMLLVILDTKTALGGAAEGITLCLYTVIPSLFPFFVLSALINSALIGSRITVLRPLGRLCGIPAGSESLLVLGLIGGYPVGAQSIYQAYHNGQLSKSDARRMLGFCNNAGPAFIFGMAASLFTSRWTPWLIWLLHIGSALIVGLLLPGKSVGSCEGVPASPVSVAEALDRGCKVMLSVCGWVVIFRVILAFCQRWFLWLLPRVAQVGFIGLLELSNGCYNLRFISSESVRFVMCVSFLSFGGLCVAMQTVSVAKELGTGMYFPGKLLQGVITFALAVITQGFLYPGAEVFSGFTLLIAVLLLVVCFLGVCLQRRKKVVAIP